MALERILTIGVYGFAAEAFFEALVGEDVDLFCDVRARRGVRGREYTFANARRLEATLAELRIAYEHFPDLAPSDETRAQQYAVDASMGLGKRQRSELSPAFVEAYEELLAGAAARTAIDAIRAAASRPVLLCVEQLPSACHRSLLAARLAGDHVPVQHLLP